jgi:hypothetical protein
VDLIERDLDPPSLLSHSLARPLLGGPAQLREQLVGHPLGQRAPLAQANRDQGEGVDRLVQLAE